MFPKILRLLALLPLAGCIQMPAYVMLEPAVQGSLKNIRVIGAVPQDEIFLSADSPGVAAAAGGGLIAAVIESQVSKSRQDAIQATITPFYAVVDDVDFRPGYWALVVPELRKLYPGQGLDVKTTAVALTRAERNRLVGALRAGRALMYVAARYSFTPDYARIDVTTSVDLWRGGQPNTGDPTPVYSNVFYYRSSSVGATGSDAIAAWSRNGGARYRAALQEGAAETARMMRLDMQYPRVKDKDEKLPQGSRKIEARKASPGVAGVTGPVLDERSGRIVVRNTDGRLHSLRHR